MAIKPRRQLKEVPIISPALRYYFETGDDNQDQFSPADRFNVFLIGFPLGKGRDLKDLWEIAKSEILKDWKKEKRPGLPWAEKNIDKKS